MLLLVQVKKYIHRRSSEQVLTETGYCLQLYGISFWFLLLASMARKECSQQHFLNVRLFSKVQFWCPSPLGWDGVNCLTKKWGAGLKHGQQFHISFWFLLLASMARKECSQWHFLNALSFSKRQIWRPSPLESLRTAVTFQVKTVID